MDVIAVPGLDRVFFTRAEALDSGWDDRGLASAVRQMLLHRICRGYYVDGAYWRSLDREGQYLMRCQAALHSMGGAVALSHVSAVVAHGLSSWGVPLDRVHVTRLDGGAGRTEAGVVHHEGLCLDDDVVEVAGGLATIPARAVIEASSLGDAESALVHFDSFLFHQGDRDELLGRLTLMNPWPHTQHLLIPARMADGGSQSVGESRGRWLFWREGLPRPTCQFEVMDANGRIVAATDWGWPEHRAFGEFDGKVKYGRLLKPGQRIEEVVFAEKEREDLVREITDFRAIRLVWVDYARPRLTAERVRRKLGLR